MTVPIAALRIGEEFEMPDGTPGTVIRHNAGRHRRAVVILEGERIGREVTLEPDCQVTRLGTRSPNYGGDAA